MLAVAKANSKSTENVKKPKNAKTINLITSADSVDLTKNVLQHDDDESGNDVDNEDNYEEKEEVDTEEEEKKFEKSKPTKAKTAK